MNGAFEAEGRKEYSGRDRAYLAADVDTLVTIANQTEPGLLVLRSLGVGGGDVAALSQAVELFDQTDAVSYAARSRIERSRLTGDHEDLAAGTRVLETLGDFDYLPRIEQYVRRPG